MEKILEVQKLVKKYNNQIILNNINLIVNKGEKIAILGANGSGKTTLVEIISKINNYNSGTINYFFSSSKNKKNIGIQLQESNWPSYLTIKNIIKFYLKTYTQVNQQEVDNLLENLKINDLLNKKAKNLSPGEKQRLNLLLAITHKPELLILDEPTNGLDLPLQKFIINYLNNFLKGKEQTLLLVSHNINEIKNLCNRIIIINNHQIFVDKKIDEISEPIEKFIEKNL